MVQKRFPATVTTGEDTFLYDKKINAELYAYLQSKSYPNDKKETVVLKSNLDKQEVIIEKIGVKSRSTLRNHLNYLIQKGYVIDDKENKCYILQEVENVFLMLPLDTLYFIQDTVKEAVYKVYIYLGQRWKWKGANYTFTAEEIAEHLGTNLSGNLTVRRQINNALIALQNNGLIDYEHTYDGKVPKYRLKNWSVHFKNV